MRISFWKYIITLIIVFNSLSSFSQDFGDVLSNDYVDILYGVVYEPENFNAVGHPFFLEDRIFNATLWFKGDEIKNISIKYDLYNQTLVLYQDFDAQKYRFIKLNSELINQFEIFDELNVAHRFIPNWIYPDLSEEIVFYEEIYSNQIKYFIGRSKNLNELVTNDFKNKFTLEQKHYFIINNKAYLVNTKRDIYDLLGSHKKAIKSLIKKNKLKIKLKNTEDIIQLISFYEDLLSKH